MRPVPGVLDDDELQEVATQFGVGEAQVRRDHVISHALAAISVLGLDDLVFFGGTALSRTHLHALRLSEDIDLLTAEPRRATAERLVRAITRSLRRSLGTPVFSPPLEETRGAEPSVMTVAGARVQIQLLSAVGYPRWPTEVRDIDQRYSDAPPARLRVLTPPAFAAAKLAAWSDRGTPRDLYDMWALANEGMIDDEATVLFSRHGPLTSARQVSFSRVPTAQEWNSALSHQCIPRVSAHEAAAVVAEAWAR